jgi:hypothetical protein
LLLPIIPVTIALLYNPNLPTRDRLAEQILRRNGDVCVLSRKIVGFVGTR